MATEDQTRSHDAVKASLASVSESRKTRDMIVEECRLDALQAFAASVAQRRKTRSLFWHDDQLAMMP